MAADRLTSIRGKKGYSHIEFLLCAGNSYSRA